MYRERLFAFKTKPQYAGNFDAENIVYAKK